MNIDADSHIFPIDCMDVAKSIGFKPFVDKMGFERVLTPRGTVRSWSKIYYDLDLRTTAMRDAGFDKQVLLCDQGLCPDYLPLDQSVRIVRAYNDAVAKIQKENEQFISAAEVPCQDPNAAIPEAERAIKDLGLKAIRIHGTWAGKNIESEEWMPFFKLVNELDVPLFLHSLGVTGQAELNPNMIAHDTLQRMTVVKLPNGEKKSILYPLAALLGFPIEAMCVVSALVMHGIFKQYPNLRLAVLESGVSWAPWLSTFLNHVSEFLDAKCKSDPEFLSGYTRISSDPGEYVRKHVWFTLDNTAEATVPVLVREMGMGSRLLAQTDFPHVEGTLDVPRWVSQMNVSESDKERMLGKNAAEILKLN